MNKWMAAFTTDELCAALLAGALAPAAGSALDSLDGHVPSANLASINTSLRAKNVLAADGRLTQGWQTALATLCAPAARLSLFLASPDHAESGRYCAGRHGAASFREVDGQQVIAFPHSADELAAVIAGWMQTASISEGRAADADLPTDAVVALAALADAYREERLHAFVDRRPPDDDPFPSTVLEYELARGLQRPDWRWLASILAAHGREALSPLPERLDRGLDVLEQEGWIERAPVGVRLIGLGREVCDRLGNTLPCVVVTAGGPARVMSILIALRGIRSFWTIDWSAGSRTARLSALDGPALELCVRRRLDQALSVERAEGASASSFGSFCSFCGQPMEGEARFCCSCGRERRAAGPALVECPGCHSSVRAGLRFCTSCGSMLAT